MNDNRAMEVPISVGITWSAREVARAVAPSKAPRCARWIDRCLLLFHFELAIALPLPCSV
jgi:hypothetical protein